MSNILSKIKRVLNLLIPTLDDTLTTKVKENLYNDFKATDKVMIVISFFNFFVVVSITSIAYNTYTLGIIFGGLLFIFSFLGYFFFRGKFASRIIFGITFISYPAIMISQQMGLIEMHFGFFILVAALTRYKDIVAILSATISAVFYHLFFTYLQLNDISIMGNKFLFFSSSCSWEFAFLHIGMFAVEVVILLLAVTSSVKEYINSRKLQIQSEENLQKLQKENKNNRRIIDATIKVANSVNEGNLTLRVSGDTSDKNIKSLKDIINNMMDNLQNKISEDINQILSILKNFTNYDFTQRIESKGEIAQKLNHLADEITKLLIENKKNGLTLENSSKILYSNVKKSNQSSSTASVSLEETAASVEEITSIIKSNNEKIESMYKITTNLNNSAEEGEKLSSKTTLAMEGINKQVSEILEAIMIIDQIAFQTNILSLNAAVEAATAGEAGRGFAVVAQEVRNLASRSTEAAKEIKELVENTTQKAEYGKNISVDMMNGYTELNENIKTTINLIKGVTNASNEQERGIIQINDAMNDLDKQIQENASLSSETNDIARQTQKISEMILSDAENKIFLGKDLVEAKDINHL